VLIIFGTNVVQRKYIFSFLRFFFRKMCGRPRGPAGICKKYLRNVTVDQNRTNPFLNSLDKGDLVLIIFGTNVVLSSACVLVNFGKDYVYFGHMHMLDILFLDCQLCT
jgi:hypothetical protein